MPSAGCTGFRILTKSELLSLHEPSTSLWPAQGKLGANWSSTAQPWPPILTHHQHGLARCACLACGFLIFHLALRTGNSFKSPFSPRCVPSLPPTGLQMVIPPPPVLRLLAQVDQTPLDLIPCGSPLPLPSFQQPSQDENEQHGTGTILPAAICP